MWKIGSKSVATRKGPGQHLDRVEHPAQKSQRLDDHVREEGDVVYPGREGADHCPQRGEGKRREHPDQEQKPRVLDGHPDERYPDHEDPGPIMRPRNVPPRE